MLFPKKTRSSQALVLEPRMMFDGAGTAEAVETSAATETDTSTAEAEESASTAVEASGEAPSITADVSIYYDSKADMQDSEYLLNSAEDMAVSSDGKFVYTVYSGGGDSAAIGVYSVDESGKLTLVHSYYNDRDESNIEGIAGATYVLLSDDEKSVYVYGETDNSIVTFSRNADTGALVFQSKADLSDFGIDKVSVYVEDMQVSNGHFYIAAGDRVVVLEVDDEGSLAEVEIYTNDQDGISGLEGVTRLTLSDDGKSLIAGGSHAISLFNVNNDGTLQFVSSVDGGTEEGFFIQSILVANDGQTVYALNNYSQDEPEILVMTLSDSGMLTLSNRYAVSTGAQSIVVSDNGAGVFVLGSNADVFSYDETNQSLTKVDTLSGGYGGDLGDEFGESSKAYLSADGSKIFVLNTQYSSDSILTYDLAVNKPSYVEGSDSVLLLPSGRISDSELDALDDYQGASYTLVRQDGGLEEDSFSFQNANGLTLENNAIFLDGNAIASFILEDNALTVTFTASTTQETAQAVLRQIAYTNTSNDPVANGASPTFVITLDDGDGNQTSLEVAINLIGVNDPAVITTTPETVTYHVGDDYTSLFSDTSIDTIEEGQLIGQLVLTITGASVDDVLNVGNNKINLLTNQSITSPSSGKLQYSVSVSGDITTVTLYLQKSAVETASIIDDITYKYEGNETSGERTVEVAVVEPWDGTASLKTSSEDKAVITLAATVNNVAPVLSDTAENISYTENGPAFTVFPNATLSDAQMDAYNGGLGSYHGAVLTVAVSDASSSDVLSFSDGNGLSLNKGAELLKDGKIIGMVSVSDGLLTVTFTENNGVMPTTQDVTNVLNQIYYRSSSDAPPSSIIISATLTDQLGLVSDALTKQIDITAVNDAPTVVTDPVLVAGDMDLVDTIDSVTGIGTVVSSTVSDDGSMFYVVGSAGNIVAFSQDADSGEWLQVGILSIDGLSSQSKIITTADGQSLYVISSYTTSDGWGGTMSVRTISVITYDSIIHELTETQKITGQYTLNSITDLALSDDEQTVYYLHDGGLGVLTRDTVTGVLTFEKSLSTVQDGDEKRNMRSPSSLTVSGDYVFLTTNSGTQKASALFVFENISGELSLLGYIENEAVDSDGAIVKLDSPSHIVATEGGQYVYVVNGNSLASYSYDAVNKSFSVVDTHVLTLENVTDMVLSDNGKELYISTSEGTLSRYVITDNGGLILVDAPQVVTNGKMVTVSASGQVFLQGDKIAVFDVPGFHVVDYEIGSDAVVIAPTTAIYDAEFAAVDNYKGLTLSIQSTSPSADDVFGVLADSGFSIQGGNLFFNDAPIGTFTVENGVLTITITSDLTQSQVNTLVQNVSYENPSLTENTTLTFAITIHDGEASNTDAYTSLNVVLNSVPEAVGDYVMPSVMEASPVSILLPEDLFVDAGGYELVWSVSGLPSGLTFDPLTRMISGQASESGTFELTVTAMNTRQQSGSLDLSLVVESLSTVNLPADENNSPTVNLPTDNDNETPPSTNDNRFVFTNNLGDAFTQDELGVDVSTAPTFDAAPLRVNNLSLAQNTLAESASVNTPVALAASSSNNLQTTTFSSEVDEAERQVQSISPLPVEPYRFTSLTWLSGDNQASVSLLDSVLSAEEKTILAVTLADGTSLPDGVAFDADTGELTINKAVFETTDQIELHILVVDEQGNASVVPVEMTLQEAQQASVLPFAQQVKNAGLMSLSDDSQALLAELSVN